MKTEMKKEMMTNALLVGVFLTFVASPVGAQTAGGKAGPGETTAAAGSTDVADPRDGSEATAVARIEARGGRVGSKR
jgi:hypothetical protein